MAGRKKLLEGTSFLESLLGQIMILFNFFFFKVCQFMETGLKVTLGAGLGACQEQIYSSHHL
jgi:hypothetical protein